MSNGLRQIPVGEPDWTLRRRDRTTAHVPAAQEDRPRDPAPLTWVEGRHVMQAPRHVGQHWFPLCGCGWMGLPFYREDEARLSGCQREIAEWEEHRARQIYDAEIREAQFSQVR